MSGAPDRLRTLAESGLEALGLAGRPDYDGQLGYELGVIQALGFEPVFLICHELCAYARANRIRMGPGRGSAAGSLVCYVLGITHLDPIRYRLDFSRFLVEGRVSPPDIDLDVERGGRDRLLGRLKELVGADRVARISTVSYLGERGALRDVARILIKEEPERYARLAHDVNIICSLVPQPTTQPLAEMATRQPLADYARRYPILFKLAARFVGLPRHSSVHAAGVVVSNLPIAEAAPLREDDQETGTMVLQWDMRDAERVGLFKLDLLVLDALDLIRETCELAGVEVDGLTPDDAEVFARFAAGDLEGIFQFDQGYVADIFREVGCDSFDDIVATNALLRPGAKATNSVQSYARNKRSTTWALGVPESARECVSDTYGLILYQEQAMRIARRCAGFSVREADDLRKGIAKDYDTSRMRGKFLEGCAERGLNEEEAAALWRVLENAGRYMFNKAHSTCYSYISYQQMWLKVHHPKEFWVATLNAHLGDEPAVKRIASKLRRGGATICGIRANRSRARCWYDGDRGEVVLGFLCIKGIGEKAAAELERLRGAASLEEWAAAANRRVLNEAVRRRLVDANVFGCWSHDEARIERAMRSATARGPRIADIYSGDQMRLI